MNFKGKSTFKRKWKRVGSLALRYERKSIDITKHIFCSHLSLYSISFVGHLFFKCDEMLDQLKQNVLTEDLGKIRLVIIWLSLFSPCDWSICGP